MEKPEIVALLKRFEISPTPQRVEIAHVMLAAQHHLSADQVLARVSTTGALVSKATVYNTLGLLAARGLIRQVFVDPAKVFYDSNTHPHYHFYNVDTGTLIDFSPDEVSIAGIPAPPAGMVTEGVELVIKVRNQTAAA